MVHPSATGIPPRRYCERSTPMNAQPSVAELLAQVAALQAQLKSTERKLSLKVSEKGALSLYGMGRFPVTLYRGQWERLLAAAPEIKAFIEANAALLAVKA